MGGKNKALFYPVMVLSPTVASIHLNASRSRDLAGFEPNSRENVVPMTDPAGAGILMLTWLGYIDGIHVTPYIAAPWILCGI